MDDLSLFVIPAKAMPTGRQAGIQDKLFSYALRSEARKVLTFTAGSARRSKLVMTTRRQVVTDEQLGQYCRKEAELRERLRFGIGGVNHKDTMSGLQVLIEARFLQSDLEVAKVKDPLSDYRRIKGLMVIGPKEWEKAMLSRDRKNRNPLDLTSGWCPSPPVPYTTEQMKKLVEICQTPDWATTPVLWLALPEVGGLPTSLVNQRNWWGVRHDELEAGNIRTDIMWSGWFSGKEYAWAEEPAVTEPTWMVGYELPCWTTCLNWTGQQEAAGKRNMSIATACRDALMCNLVAIATGKKFRLSTWSRTATVYRGGPLGVSWYLDYGLCVFQFWNPEDSSGGFIGASAEGVPMELGP